MTSVNIASRTELDPGLNRLANGSHHDPFALLGRHLVGKDTLLRVFRPHAQEVYLPEQSIHLQRVAQSDFFEWRGDGSTLPQHYRLAWTDDQGNTHMGHDPYDFAPQLGDLDIHLFSEGRHWHAYRFMGGHPYQADDIPGVLFAVWAPNAERISVVGDFNRWDGRVNPMRCRGACGVWELFVPGLTAGALYKYEIRTRTGEILEKADPYAKRTQLRPATASVAATVDGEHQWRDDAWMGSRPDRDWQHAPMSVYEVHLGSWQRDESDRFLDYREIAPRLSAHVGKLGFTHVELLPITEHPLDASWGYQATGYFAPTARFGDPDGLRYLIDHLHQHGIGVILDWVPAHFPRDEFALARFDGTALYEHSDPRRGEHRDWGTLIFNYGRREVKNFLLSSAIFWLQEFHIDGVRVDAVASMLYLDYSREPGDWVPNEHGGRENLEAVAFLREMNEVVHEQFPGAVTIAEESTAWPQVSRPTWLGGLGFSMKWNMGWMHDTLSYLGKDPIHRHYHHDELTFGLLYAFTENFVLPFSHDEVVHGKGTLINRMPGDEWQQFANLRLLYAFQFTYPGKKLLFMGQEYGERDEWSEARSLKWWLRDYPVHSGVEALVGDLNRLYRELPALHRQDFSSDGFAWIDCHDNSQSVISYLRRDEHGNQITVIINFTPIPRQGYRIGLPYPGAWRELLNTDANCYGGSDMGNGGLVHTEDTPWMDQPYSAQLTLPPLAALVLQAQN